MAASSLRLQATTPTMRTRWLRSPPLPTQGTVLSTGAARWPIPMPRHHRYRGCSQDRHGQLRGHPVYTLTLVASPAEAAASRRRRRPPYRRTRWLRSPPLPTQGYRFVNWSGEVADPNAPSTTVTVDAAKTVTANFEAIPIYTPDLVASPADGGIISPPQATPPTMRTRWLRSPPLPTQDTVLSTGAARWPIPMPPSTTPLPWMQTKTVTANFEAIPVYTLTLVASPADGGIISSACRRPHTYSEGRGGCDHQPLPTRGTVLSTGQGRYPILMPRQPPLPWMRTRPSRPTSKSQALPRSQALYR